MLYYVVGMYKDTSWCDQLYFCKITISHDFFQNLAIWSAISVSMEFVILPLQMVDSNLITEGLYTLLSCCVALPYRVQFFNILEKVFSVQKNKFLVYKRIPTLIFRNFSDFFSCQIFDIFKHIENIF